MNYLDRCCDNCKYHFYDGSVDAHDCNKADDIPEDLFEKHFVNDKSGCPFHRFNLLYRKEITKLTEEEAKEKLQLIHDYLWDSHRNEEEIYKGIAEILGIHNSEN